MGPNGCGAPRVHQPGDVLAVDHFRNRAGNSHHGTLLFGLNLRQIFLGQIIQIEKEEIVFQARAGIHQFSQAMRFPGKDREIPRADPAGHIGGSTLKSQHLSIFASHIFEDDAP